MNDDEKDSDSQEGEDKYISFTDICEYSNTGDILLFHTKSSSGAVVRAATGGDYDHIGMIFRLKGGKVGVLEALGSGVQVFLWTNFRKYNWHKQYPKIAFRSLIIPDDDKNKQMRKEITKKLALFVKTVVNRHYGWNPIQLIRKQSTVSLYDESRTFFCSELIAKAFKEVGLLRPDFGSAQYFPSHFQENKGLKLLKGCSFSKEMEVIWTDDDVNNYSNSSIKSGISTGLTLMDSKSETSVSRLKDIDGVNGYYRNAKENHANHKNGKETHHHYKSSKKLKKNDYKNLTKGRSKTTGTTDDVTFVSLQDHSSADSAKKPRLKSPPPRQLF